MTETMALPPPSDAKRSGKGRMRWLFTLVLLTLLAVGTGGGFGLVMMGNIEKRVEAKYKAASEMAATASPYSGDIAIQRLAAVVTNLSNSGDYWVRMEASIIYKKDTDINPEVLAAETRQDIVAYLRSLTITQIQGPSGLLHLREDLNERAQLRSKGLIREFVVESLVVQ
jgi:flagellar FliL protein